MRIINSEKHQLSSKCYMDLSNIIIGYVTVRNKGLKNLVERNRYRGEIYL